MKLKGFTLSGSRTKFYGYDDITLKLYTEISESGDLSRLVIRGNPTPEERFEAWEQIVSKNSELNGGTYSTYFYTYQSYLKLINDYYLVKALIIAASIKNDLTKSDEIFDQLRNKGFRVNTTNDQTLKESLLAISRSSENLVTRIKMKKNEMDKYGGGKKIGFTTLIANLSVAMAPVVISEDIKLSLYNEYCKIIREREQNREKRRNK